VTWLGGDGLTLLVEAGGQCYSRETNDRINQGNSDMPVHCKLFFIACLYGTGLGKILYNFHCPIELGIDELARVHGVTYPEHTLPILTNERIQIWVGVLKRKWGRKLKRAA
jgi:hypothetical protein